MYCRDLEVMSLSPSRVEPSWSIKVSIAAQKFAASITDFQGSDTTWELRVGRTWGAQYFCHMSCLNKK